MAEALSYHLVEIANSFNWKFDIVTAVPLSVERYQQRGYNQSGLLALPLALTFGVPFAPKAIVRNRNTPSQVGLSKKERQSNVKGAFTAKNIFVENQTVLIVDDVKTTGATMQACSKALLEAGAQKVYGLTLARAVLETDLFPENFKPAQPI